MVIALDSEFQDVLYSPVCLSCAHCSDPVEKKCAAFPAGIPAEIWNGNHRHRKPYVGDHGIQFAPNKPAVKGGPGSGFHGHAGRPGKRGGSAPAGTAPGAPDMFAPFERNILRLDHEEFLVVDDDGELVQSVKGGDSSVEIPDDVAEKMKGLQATHNHPGGWEFPESNPQHGGNSFSPGDIKVACEGELKEIRVVTPKYIYSMKPPPGGWNIKYWEHDLMWEVDTVQKQVQAEGWHDIFAKKWTIDEASSVFWHDVWQRVAEKKGLRYSRVEHDYNA